MAPHGYSRVPGSDHLKTAPRGDDDEVAALEALDPSATAGRWVHGEWLCRVVVREGAVEVLDDVFDRLLPLHEAEEAAVYLQLYRLSYGHERNWCRTSRKVLRERANLSDRRLGGALAGLVERDHVRLLHRDRRGTLYRVRLPHEIFDEPDHDRVFSARPSPPGPAAAGSAKKRKKRRNEPKASRREEGGAKGTQRGRRSAPGEQATKPKAKARETRPEGIPETAATAELVERIGSLTSKEYQNNTLLKRSTKRVRRLTVGGVAAAFLERFPSRTASKSEVVEAVFLRMEDNITLAEIADELQRFGEQAPARLKLSDLARWLEAK